MKILKRIVLGLLAMTALLMLAIVAVQTWYHFTPVELSAEAKALDERAARLPTITENGYRLFGIQAPLDIDPVVYGRCLLDVHWANFNDKPVQTAMETPQKGALATPASESGEAARTERAEQRARDCARGGKPLRLPEAMNNAKLGLAVRREELSRIAALNFDPVLHGRAEQVWAAGDARRLGLGINAPIPFFTPLVAIERWRTARAGVAWDTGDRAAAIASWNNSIRNWVKSADDTLIDAMLSTSLLTQVLLVVQQSAAQSPSLDEQTANAIVAAITPIEAMPHALADSLLAEWQWSSAAFEELASDGKSMLPYDANFAQTAIDRLGRLSFDRNDMRNRWAKAHMWSQRTVLQVAGGEADADPPAEITYLPCEWAESFGYACFPFTRNPGGRLAAVIALPLYSSYGMRISDLLNLANATRLTVRARQLGLTGAALEKFVADAPPDLRDISTKKPFRYDATERKLHIELRTKSTILGDKGTTYALPL